MKVFVVAGARPNFVKVAPVYKALSAADRFAPILVHTGQHYDEALSDVFFQDLGIPRPDIALQVGSGTHGEQTGRVLERFERVLIEQEPDLVVVVGDVNSTIACALAAVKTTYRSGRRAKIAHIEAGLRSFDRTMPEEINRVLTDAISDYLFVTEQSGMENLRREGIPAERAFLVGNVMIDTLLSQIRKAAAGKAWERFDLREHEYALLTLHRPANVDDKAMLTRLMAAVSAVSARLPVVFPAHPRTAFKLQSLDLPTGRGHNELRVVAPIGYVEFLGLMSRAKVVLTDSGGIQEETTVLGIPCLTLRDNTERPVTITHGTNTLVGRDPESLLSAVERVLAGQGKTGSVPPLWDGNAAQRIVAVLEAQSGDRNCADEGRSKGEIARGQQ